MVWFVTWRFVCMQQRWYVCVLLTCRLSCCSSSFDMCHYWYDEYGNSSAALNKVTIAKPFMPQWLVFRENLACNILAHFFSSIITECWHYSSWCWQQGCYHNFSAVGWCRRCHKISLILVIRWLVTTCHQRFKCLGNLGEIVWWHIWIVM